MKASLMGAALVVACAFVSAPVLADDWWSTSSYLGGSAGGAVPSAAILSDGTVVLAAQIGDSVPGGKMPILLNGATAASGGAIVRLSANGKEVLSVTRVAEDVREVSVDGSDNIYVAALLGGLLKLSADGSQLLWKKSDGGICFRVDAGENGEAAALYDNSDDPTSVRAAKGAPAAVFVYDASGATLGNFSVKRGDGGSNDLALDAGAKTVFVGGYKNTSQNGGLTVPFINAFGYAGGAPKWTDYDHAYAAVFASTDIADSFVSRLHFGPDGKLYALGYEAGGNTVWRRDPKDLSKMSALDAIDEYNDGSRMGGPANRGFYARFSPSDGSFEGGALYQAVTPDKAVAYNKTGLFLDTADGDIKADAVGRVYIVSAKNGKVLPYTFDPLGLLTADGGKGANGAGLTILAPDLKSRLYVTSFVNTNPGGRGQSVAVRQIAGQAGQSVVYGGRMNFDAAVGEVFLKEPVQPQRGGATCGWFGVANAAPFVGKPTGGPSTSASTGVGGGASTSTSESAAGSTSGTGDPGAGGAGGASTGGGATTDPSSGCSCRIESAPDQSAPIGGLVVTALGLAAIKRRRARSR
jgi:MYXO-CTERM domain-containing protein